MKFSCIICNKEFSRSPSQAQNAKCCSQACSSIRRKNITGTNCKCTYCDKDFHIKNSVINRYKRTHGIFCSKICYALWKRDNLLGPDNPNFRRRLYDENGYLMVHIFKKKSMGIHRYIACEVLKIKEIPKYYDVHHRDCNYLNNEPNNLAVLNKSDHWWLHKQFGSASLWAFMRSKISLEELASWSNNIEKAKKLLEINILNQIGIIKSGEFGESPEVGNTEPSTNLNDE